MSNYCLILILNENPVYAEGLVEGILDRFGPNGFGRFKRWRIGGNYCDLLKVMRPKEAFDFDGVFAREATEIGADIAQIENIIWPEMVRRQMESRKLALEIGVRKMGDAGYDEMTVSEFSSIWSAYANSIDEIEAQWENLPKKERPSFPKWIDNQDPEKNPVTKAKLSGVLSLGAIILGIPHGCNTVQKWLKSSPAIGAKAIIKNNQWYEVDGISDWGIKLQSIINSTPKDHWIAIIECEV